MKSLRRRVLLLAVIAAVLLYGIPAPARMRVKRPINVHMQLYVGQPPAGVTPQFVWPVADRDGEYTLQITTLSVFGSDTTALRLDDAVRPYQIKFRLGGDQDAVRRLTRAAPGQLMTVRGIARLQGGARYLMIDAVSPVAPPPPAQP